MSYWWTDGLQALYVIQRFGKNSARQISRPDKRFLADSYSGDLNTDHFNTGNIWILKFLKFGFQMVTFSNGRFMYYVLYVVFRLPILVLLA